MCVFLHLSTFLCGSDSFLLFELSCVFDLKTVKVEKIISHKDYNQKTNENDIALLKLQSPLQFNECVRPVGILNSELPPLETCTVTGWGAIRESTAVN